MKLSEAMSVGWASLARSEKMAAPEGSYEDLVSDLNALINPDPNSSNYDWRTYNCIVGTFPDYFIMCQWDEDGIQTYWKVAYTVGADKEPILGDTREQLEVDYVPVGTGAYSDSDEDEGSTDKELQEYAILAHSEKAGSGSDLSDSAFAYVEPGHKVDGKTPNKYRHFRIDDAKHARLAVQLLSTSPFGDKAASKVKAAARRYGIKIDKSKSSTTKEIETTIRSVIKSVMDPIITKVMGMHQEMQTTLANGGTHVKDDSIQPLLLQKDADGRVRYFCFYTNNYRDRHGQIISAAAHKEFADACNSSKTYPEMWLWHTKGTEWGQTDYLNYSDGVMMATGLVHQGKEVLAERLAEMGTNLGFSHGMIGLIVNKENVWTKYRDYEITALPRARAANLLTSPLELITAKEEEMALTPERREWFKSECKMSDEQIDAADKTHTEFAAGLKTLGIQSKELELGGGTAGEGSPTLGLFMVGQSEIKTALNELIKANLATQEMATKALETAKSASVDLESKIKEMHLPANAAAMLAKTVKEEPAAPSANGQMTIDEQAQKDADWFKGLVAPVLAGIPTA